MHYDTTSVSVYGDYKGQEETVEITYGYSKDHRADLKQFMMDALCIEGNIPLLGAVLNGNNAELTEIASFMKKNGIDPMATVYIADSA